MKTKHVLFFCFLAAFILISSTSDAADMGTGDSLLATLNKQTVDPIELSQNPHFIILTKGEVLYMLSRDNLTIERWSVADRKFLLPVISLTQAPDFIAYSDETDRIYLSYPNNRITQIKLDQLPLREVPFISTPYPVKGMTVAGSFIFTVDASRHSTYSTQGSLISQVDRPIPGAYHTWSPADRRLYFFVDSLYVNDFQWEAIGIDGVILSIAAPPHSEYEIYIPLRVKPDGSLLFFGSGTLLNATTLEKEWVSYSRYMDAIWHEDDLFTAKTTPATRESVLEAIKGQYYDRVASYILNSMIIRLFKVSEGILGVSFDDNGAILFSLLDLDLNLLYQTPYYHSYFPLVEKDHCWNFYDDFSQASSGWAVGEDEDVGSEYLNGEYRVLTKNDDYYYMFMAPASCKRQYYQVEVDARWVGEPGYSYGIVYGIKDDWSQYYLFGVNSEYQILDLYQIRDGYISELSHRYSSAIRTGANTNHLKVTRKFEQLLLEINGTVVSDVFDDNPASSGVGVFVIPYDEYPLADARFDHFLESFLSRSEIYSLALNDNSLVNACSFSSERLPVLQLKMKWPIIRNR
jgi:hypothetical protein